MKSAVCIRSTHVSARCEVCHALPEPAVHMPVNKHGFFCAAHCPACNKPAVAAPSQPVKATLKPDRKALPQPMRAVRTLRGSVARGRRGWRRKMFLCSRARPGGH